MCLLDLMAALRSGRPGWPLALIAGEDGPLRHEAEALGVSCRVLPLPESVARLGDSGLRGRDGKSRGRLGLAVAAAPAVGPAAAYFARLRRAIRRESAGLVHANGMKALVLAAFATPRKVPVVWHLHDFLGGRPVMGRLLKIAARPGISGVGVSRAVAEDASRVLAPRVPVRVAYNAADLDRFAPDGPRADLDAASGLPPAPGGALRVGLVGTFARWKGQDVFLDACARLDRESRELAGRARFYIVGGPIYKTGGSQWSIDELTARAEALGLAGRVGFAGFQADPAAAIRALDVVVHASTRPEPFGRVIVEGMACAKAVIAVQGGGSAELIDDGRTALAIPPDDPSALASALARLLADPGLRARLGSEGRSEALARFDRRDLADRWAAIYGDASAARRGGATVDDS